MTNTRETAPVGVTNEGGPLPDETPEKVSEPIVPEPDQGVKGEQALTPVGSPDTPQGSALSPSEETDSGESEDFQRPTVAFGLLKFARSDAGNAERLRAEYGMELLYSDTWRKWLLWRQVCWKRDSTLEIQKMALATIRRLENAAVLTDREDRESYIKWALAQESNGKLQAMVNQARALFAVEADVFDRDPWLLNLRNGTFNLQTMKLQKHHREDFITKLAPISYKPDANCPQWLRFLDTIMDGNEDLIGFLQRAVGYSLAGDTGEECIFIPYGSGRNGKSKFLGAIKDMLGSDYSLQLKRDELMVKRGGGITEGTAALRGVRFATAVETDEGQRLDEGFVKALTGGDEIRARHLYENSFEFKPECKLWLATNHKPRVRGTDEAIWSRIKLIPFSVYIKPQDRDTKLAAKLRRELPGIFNWAIEGCKQWQEHGLGDPPDIEEATKQYRYEEDKVQQWIDDYCATGEFCFEQASALLDNYRNNMKDFQMTPNRFADALEDKGYRREKKGVVYWHGLMLDK